MTRIVAGVAGGRRLGVPPGTGTRPTSERAREALFNSLGSVVAGARFADLYAGSGAVGLEALSRGAVHALLVEAEPPALRALRANVAALGLPGSVVVADRVERLTAGPPAGEPYDVVFADPPYATPDADVAGVLGGLVAHGWLAPDAVVVVERSVRSGDLTWVAGLTADRDRRYGEGRLWYGRRS